ncbi:MAG TPA: pyrimidine dimer DNA glycosylase/endonuclease V [Pseudomonadales bacterium]|jgi:hypothetical protein|nr:pyrimidine dimer DNA glycosylase/endonuclease V [Pseudomonadales bacterium]HMW14347.1 pyrimidine dimer DNA glycosylase/endonuclease V [Pseudomonadales bacterium]HMW83063.1 pyrimidine dimer DNA glycosylase/endonuclease V [Pseudomonadales bacterium]HMY96521.1 pyrimidine dimer DNA glycosylase/endonuclease V [Pseudomonadales bacterium]HMZ70570.1 pyrimidine dimer DNA glycosylase/endonuclease V [Pseudomonadales bacterium]
MRIWSLHPRYLDAKGLVALWREALLAQAVLAGQTRGYQRHPQLLRFSRSANPDHAIASYLRAVHAEATHRGYRFDAAKIGPGEVTTPMPVTQGQLLYEWSHLVRKLHTRAPAWLDGLDSMGQPDPHPLFRVVAGEIEPWEVITAQ